MASEEQQRKDKILKLATQINRTAEKILMLTDKNVLEVFTETQIVTVKRITRGKDVKTNTGGEVKTYPDSKPTCDTGKKAEGESTTEGEGQSKEKSTEKSGEKFKEEK